MLILKALHIIFMVTWFAALFYLPRLFVYHAQSSDQLSLERFCVMERKLFWGIMTPGAVLTCVLGLWLALWEGVLMQGWMHAKLTLVLLLVVYHIWCYALLRAFKAGRNRHTHVWYRWFNEAPTLLLFAIVFLVVLKP